MDAAVPVATRQTTVTMAFVVLAIAVATIAGAFGFEAAGYAPCDLCLKERLPYYAAMALAAVTILVAGRGARMPTILCFALLTLLFLGSAAFGIYHAGVEWQVWPGPSDCTGALTRASTNADFLHQLQTVKVVRCDAVAIRILGLSLAAWNAVVSLIAASLAAVGLRRALG